MVVLAAKDYHAPNYVDNLQRRKMMRVVDHEPQWWFLLEEDGSLFLDANCNLSFVGYSFLLQLSAEELSAYARDGRAFINRLATEIQDSAPIARASTSRFKRRDLTGAYSDKVMRAIESWRANT
jgi:hypothetical protein